MRVPSSGITRITFTEKSKETIMDRHESHKRGKKGKKKNYHRLKGGDKRNGGLADDAATPRTFSARTY